VLVVATDDGPSALLIRKGDDPPILTLGKGDWLSQLLIIAKQCDFSRPPMLGSTTSRSLRPPAAADACIDAPWDFERSSLAEPPELRPRDWCIDAPSVFESAAFVEPRTSPPRDVDEPMVSVRDRAIQRAAEGWLPARPRERVVGFRRELPVGDASSAELGDLRATCSRRR
jgi:hypothetical protein